MFSPIRSLLVVAHLAVGIIAADGLTVGAQQPTTDPAGSTTTDSEKPQPLELAEGAVQLKVPGDWKAVEPRSRIISHEYSIPAAEDDDENGRMTIMSAGGSVEANINRWISQFQTGEGKPLAEDRKKLEEKTIKGQKVHLVDLRGNFQDQPRGPFGPTVSRSDYRMLAAIVPTESDGTWFIKFYGPEETVTAAEAGFRSLVESIEVRQD